MGQLKVGSEALPLNYITIDTCQSSTVSGQSLTHDSMAMYRQSVKQLNFLSNRLVV